MSRKEQRAARRAALSPAQKEALQARLKGQGQAVEQRRTIAHAYARQEGVMSFAQKRQWFFWQLDPENTAYHMCGGLRLQGVLDVPALCSALQTVLDRHAVLRTTFQADEQEGVRALVHAHIDLELAQIDLSESAGAIPSLEDCIAQACQRPFDLIQGPVWRFELLRTAEQDHHLLVVVHHIACDEWSVQIILNELQALYRANCLGQAANLADLPIEYADYAQWQQDWMQGAEATRQLDWWRSELGNEHDVIALPVDQARRADSSYRAAQYGLTLDADVLERLKAYAGQSGSTLFMVLMAAFHACLYRYTGQGVVRAGFPLAQRHLSETNAVVGMFINTQIVQSRPHGRMSLQELLVQIKQAVIDAQMHQDLPFDHLVEALQPQRHAGVHPLFQVMFNHLRREGQESLSWPQLQVQRLHFAEPHAQFELAVQTLEDETGALNIRFVYAQELFKPERIARMAAHYQAVLLALLEGGETRLDEVSMLDKVDIQPLLAWANGPTQEIDFVPVHRLFEQQAAACPDAPALIVDDVAVSYETLNTQANRLAHALLARGLGADQLVGIALERSLDMVVSLLAVLKAGAAYVPLDPDYPAQRLAHMVQDSGLRWVLTQRGLRPVLPVGEHVCVVELDQFDTQNQPGHNLAVAVHEEQLAYVIYTSGSTGLPKGVGNRHVALLNRLQWMQAEYGLSQDDVVLQKTPFSFDVSVWEFFWPLIQGASLVLARPGEHKDPSRLVQTMVRHGVTTLHFVPSMLQAFMQHDSVRHCTSVRRILCSGEALPAEACQQVLALLPTVQLHNLYGPTEAAIDVTSWTCSAGHLGTIPIGHPIWGMQVYVLDGGMNLTPSGVAGELYLGGVGLARGYENRTELTAERFVADPFSDTGARLYRTGDLVRWNEAGQLEYLGRLDHQVKVRGFRIELGEVESQLLSLDGVREAVVVARSGPQGMQLVGYVSGDVSGLTLREQLSSQLPDYMVPSVIMVLEALPLNANGKIDRKALPEPEFVSGQTYEAPQGELETTLATIWSQVLGVEQVGRQDNFFELGGHSLLALTLIERLRAAGIVSQVRTLFQHPVLSAFASAQPQDAMVDIPVPANGIPADCTAITPEMLPLVSLSQAEIDTLAQQVPGGMGQIQDIYPLAPLQQGMLFHHLLDGQGDAYVAPTLLSFDSRERLERFVDSLNQVIARHDILRTSVHWEGLSDPVQVVHRAAQVTVQWPELHENSYVQVSRSEQGAGSPSEGTGDQGATIRARLEALGEQRMDVRQAPLLRLIAANDPAAKRYLLSVSLHHLISDHTTLERMIQEISLIQQNQHEALPAVVPFRNFVAQSVLGADEASHRAFFTEMLGDVEEPTAPFGVLDIQGDGSAVEEVSQPLPAALSQAIRELARSQAVSAASVFHLAWALVLSVTSAQSRPVFGTVLFGRMQGGQGIDQAMGMFINTLPVCIDLEHQSVAQALQQTHQRLTALLSHEHASLSLAQQCSGVPAGVPLFTSMLNYRYIAPEDASQAQAWEGMQVLSGQERTNFPVDLSVDDRGDEFVLVAQVITQIGASRILAYMQQALQALMLGTVTMREMGDYVVGVPESEQLLRLGRHPQAYEYREAVHVTIERQARHHPDALALVCQGQLMSYAHLDQRANQLAHLLIAQGVGVESAVGLAVERSADMIVAVLAVLKAGGVYVPLDPNYPQDRQTHIVHDSAMAYVLTDRHWNCAFALPAGVQVLNLDELPFTDQPAEAPVVPVHADNLAYLIYTSGSTGQPKGVAMTHRDLAVQSAVTRETFGLTDRDRVLQFSTINFDGFIEQVFPALSVGASLVVRGPDLWDSTTFYEQLLGEQITVVDLTTAYWTVLIHDFAQRGYRGYGRLRLMQVGGEALAPEALNSWRAAGLESVSLLNSYGPTEASVTATIFDCAPYVSQALPLPAQMQIGRALGTRQLYVLDAQLSVCPLGVAGELYIGGPLLARAYQNRAELTAERFVADPFSRQGARLYRTGDRVCWNEAGQLEYLGRLDHQVKVRGFRIELGEVESQLLSLEGVREAVVVARSGPQGMQLVGYVSGDVSGLTLRDQLSSQLPDYMVPSVIMVLEALPLNANGKIDRKALPEPEFASGQAYEAPQGELETTLATIWSQVLGVEQVGRQDNFFELGGHSLLAMQIVNQIRHQLSLPMALAQLFQAPSVQSLAALLAVQDSQRDGGAAMQELDAFMDSLLDVSDE